MTSSTRACEMVNDFLVTMDYDAPRGSQGRRMMEKKLRTYLWWKGELNRRKQPQNKLAPAHSTRGGDADAGISEALRKKDREFRERQANRRRVRGGAPAISQASGREKSTVHAGTQGAAAETVNEADTLAAL